MKGEGGRKGKGGVYIWREIGALGMVKLSGSTAYLVLT
jgi:hypothetical protein